MNEFFKGQSISEKGTLCQLKNFFGHKQVSCDVMNSFNYVDNFVRFVTEAHVVYLAMHLLEMDRIGDTPNNAPKTFDSSTTKKEYLESVSKRIVDKVWSFTPSSEIQSVIDAGSGATSSLSWCVCEKGMNHSCSIVCNLKHIRTRYLKNK